MTQILMFSCEDVVTDKTNLVRFYFKSWRFRFVLSAQIKLPDDFHHYSEPVQRSEPSILLEFVQQIVSNTKWN